MKRRRQRRRRHPYRRDVRASRKTAAPRADDGLEGPSVLTTRGREVAALRLGERRAQLAAAIREHLAGRSEREAETSSDRITLLAREISYLEDLIEDSDDLEPWSGRRIVPGDSVAMIDTATGEPLEYRLVNGDGHHAPNVVSPASPIGQALLGRRVGSLVTLALPHGEIRRVRIVGSEPAARVKAPI